MSFTIYKILGILLIRYDVEYDIVKILIKTSIAVEYIKSNIQREGEPIRDDAIT